MQHSEPTLLHLPLELRLVIYDLVLQHLLVDPEHHNTYVFPTEWPTKSFARYRALLLTCKQVNMEVADLFSTKYAAEVTIYYDNVRDLRPLVEQSRMLGPDHPLHKLKISLRTEQGTDPNDFREQIREVMIAQFPREVRPDIRHCWSYVFGMPLSWPCRFENLVSLDSTLRMNSKIEVLRFSAMNSSSMEVTVRQMAGLGSEYQYEELKGNFRDLAWPKRFEKEELQQYFDMKYTGWRKTRSRANKRRTSRLQGHMLTGAELASVGQEPN